MPRYFFDIKHGHRLVDPAGLECPNDRDAREKAAVIARRIAEDSSRSVARHVAILNGERQEIGKVPIGNMKGEK